MKLRLKYGISCNYFRSSLVVALLNSINVEWKCLKIKDRSPSEFNSLVEKKYIELRNCNELNRVLIHLKHFLRIKSIS